MTRTFRYILIIGGAVMGILLFLLASGAENTHLFEQHYAWLLGLNILAGLALLGLIVLILIRFVKRYRRGRFGSRLMMRLMLLFMLMGVIPGAVIYAVSVRFVSRSIESWFDVRVEAALNSGVRLGQNILESSLSDLGAQAEQLSAELSSLSLSEQILVLTRLRNDKNRLEAAIITGNGHVVATSSTDYRNLLPDLPTPAMLRQAALSRYLAIEGKDDDPQTAHTNETTLKLRVIVPLSSTLSMHYRQESRFLQLIQPISASLAADAEALRNAYGEYQVRTLSRSGLRKIYIVTLTLTLLLAVFTAIAIAFQITANLTRPLLLLAQGTKAVAEGDLSSRITVTPHDELGTLVQSFNDMTRQLAEAREQTEKNRVALETAKARLESVLANMSAGVIVLDQAFALVSCNESVTRILRQNLGARAGELLSAIKGLETFAAAIAQAFSEMSAQTAASGKETPWHYWQKQIEVPQPPEKEGEEAHDITLLARGSRLPVEGEIGYIIVFDDITEIISAQRSLAWGEVARRLAHEIKNPLTPIQLSAERLQMKLSDKLAEAEAQFLDKSTQTIINQVTAMKQMVDDFRNYARTPPAQLAALDLNRLVEDIACLYAGDNSRDSIYTYLDPDLPQIMGDATQLRQVIHNLLQNALDAVDEVPPEPSFLPRIDVTTEKVTYHNASGEICIAVRLSVMDNGSGFQQKMLSRIFEPYTTTKARGTGLGMAVVRKIIDEHHGRIDVANREDTHGAIVSILLLQLAPKATFMPSSSESGLQ